MWRAGLGTALLVAALASAVALLEAQEADIALYDAGRRVSLSQTRSAELRRSAMELFHQCRTWQAVTGTDPSQAELRGLWEDQARKAHVVLRPEGRSFILRMGVDPELGITPVLTERDGLLTWYIKCPGLEATALGCEFSRELAPSGEWPVCAAIERIRDYVPSRAETE